MSEPRACKAVMIAAPSSGHGKTTVTAALARHAKNAGRRVRCFKVGPDFLDPMILERASGAPVYQLDLWMVGEAGCRALLYDAAGEADLIIVEGVMGLFDGKPSSADLAATFGLPVVAVIDATAMAQTFGAIAHGLATYRDAVKVVGVIGNRSGGERHTATLVEGCGAVPFLGALPREKEQAIPSRHLGLLQADEIADLDARLDRAAASLDEAGIALPETTVIFTPCEVPPAPTALMGRAIAVAKDAAFSFVYRANLDLLQSMGATLTSFSPLTDPLPDADGYYLPGGYPELHLDALAHAPWRDGIRAAVERGTPVVAECGGMLSLLDSLTDADGARASMAGVVPGHGVMQKRLVNLGLHAVDLPGGAMRGHTFHHSTLETPLAPVAASTSVRPGGKGEGVYRVNRLTATYLHFYFPSNPEATAQLFAPNIERNHHA
ncbi:MAG: cobyrinate a,c-diamide synthase [Nitrospinae bacterium]|nr:cobyrinate a,c-diamide synthase [Nitrospinota bacterium]